MSIENELFGPPRVGFQARVRVDFHDVLTAAKASTALNLLNWAPTVIEAARESIVTDRRPSAPGRPPHTRGKPGKNLREAIQWYVDEGARDFGDLSAWLVNFPYAVIYVDRQMIGPIGELMEYGGERGGKHYEARPFLEPAVEKLFNPELFNIRQDQLRSREAENALQSFLN